MAQTNSNGISAAQALSASTSETSAAKLFSTSPAADLVSTETTAAESIPMSFVGDLVPTSQLPKSLPVSVSIAKLGMETGY